jgi:hypothetical protein
MRENMEEQTGMELYKFSTKIKKYFTTLIKGRQQIWKETKMKKGIQKPSPPCYFAWRTTEEMTLKFNNKLCG